MLHSLSACVSLLICEYDAVLGKVLLVTDAHHDAGSFTLRSLIQLDAVLHQTQFILTLQNLEGLEVLLEFLVANDNLVSLLAAFLAGLVLELKQGMLNGVGQVNEAHVQTVLQHHLDVVVCQGLLVDHEHQGTFAQVRLARTDVHVFNGRYWELKVNCSVLAVNLAGALVSHGAVSGLVHLLVFVEPVLD